MPESERDRHLIIEASAGTGKTYAIERLVLRLLTEKQLSLDQILVVTFTEKATGDLKGRLRTRLEGALKEAAEHRARLQEALDGFDQAHVYTIHGFCQRVLQEYAFENRHDFRPQLVRDPDLVEACLREMQRRGWWQEYGERLATVLELSGYNSGKAGAEAWEGLVREVAQSYRRACGHVLLPELLATWPALLDEEDRDLRTLLDQLREKAGPVPAAGVEEHRWYLGYGALPVRQDWRDAWRRKVLVPVLAWLSNPSAAERPLTTFGRLLDECSSDRFKTYGFPMLTERLDAKAQAQLPTLCAGLIEAMTLLETQRQRLNISVLGNQLAVQTVRRLQDQLHAHKAERGLQSFEDMLTRVDAALEPGNARADALRDALRRRFRYAIVDEFQDTDPVQWRIFRRLFVDGASEQRLVVVGDPKQAIFGFRGADVEAYLEARSELCTRFRGEQRPQDTNWRSCPELLAALNRLFAAGEWFRGTGIDYREVQAADDACRPNRLLEDRTGRPALSLVDLSAAPTLTAARVRQARFIAGEIQRLLAGSKPTLEYENKKQERQPLQAGDICVLVFKRPEARPLLDELRAFDIPFSFYKEPGLWQCDEATHLRYLLRAVAGPGDRRALRAALLTRFFRIPPEQLAAADELPADHPARERFQRWYDLANRRQWAELFQSFLEDTGVLLAKDDPDPDRTRANYRHLLQTLEQAAYSRDLDMLGVLETFETLRRQPGDREGNRKPIETERPRVCIMTIHASKGLEFPVVFLAGGFTGGRTPTIYTYRNDERKLVFDLSREDTAKNKHKEERTKEDRRLLYVALTRAMFKLYVPCLADRNPAAPAAGGAKHYHQPGPVAEIVTPALTASRLEEMGSPYVERIATDGPLPDLPVRAGQAEERPAAVHVGNGSVDGDGRKSVELVTDLFPSIDLTDRRGVRITSFSRLHRQLAETASYADRAPRADDDRGDVLEVKDQLRGPVFGDMVHDVLAEIDFGAVGHAPTPSDLLRESKTRPLLEAKVQRHLPRLFARQAERQLREACHQQVADLVWHALHTPLDALGGPLGQVPKADRLHELEFHFPCQEDPPPAVRRDDRFLTGFIDLVVRRGGRYFLLDWKTNTLPAYGPAELADNMRACDYVRQCRLYLQALVRWLGWVRGGDFDFARDFGGVYYLYLRGLEAGAGSGVYFQAPTADDLRLENVLGDYSW